MVRRSPRVIGSLGAGTIIGPGSSSRFSRETAIWCPCSSPRAATVSGSSTSTRTVTCRISSRRASAPGLRSAQAEAASMTITPAR